MIVSKPISFFKQENSGNGYDTDDENNEINRHFYWQKKNWETLKAESVTYYVCLKGIWKLLFLKIPDI